MFVQEQNRSYSLRPTGKLTKHPAKVEKHGDSYSGREDAPHVNSKKEQPEFHCWSPENTPKYRDWPQVTTYYTEEPIQPEKFDPQKTIPLEKPTIAKKTEEDPKKQKQSSVGSKPLKIVYLA